jgi:hypothetical protein
MHCKKNIILFKTSINFITINLFLIRSILPESPRWLIQQKRNEEAIVYLNY